MTVAGRAGVTETHASIEQRAPADMKGRSASPCRSPSPITAPIVAAAATDPDTNTSRDIARAVIARKETGAPVAQGDVAAPAAIRAQDWTSGG